MHSTRWKEIDGLLQECLDLDHEASAQLLQKVGERDAELKAKVEALLAIDAKGWDFIESAAFESAAPFMADDQPRLTPGDRIGHYEIVELIGRGGMGEVYVAKDQNLNRMVALKFLTAEYTEDKDRLVRFEREAQAASALNHPHILTIYQLGNVDGQQFIATELIEGETLRQRLVRAPITLVEALDVAIQVAGALAAAHRAGIIHRDIKPENIMLRPDGYIKVLDFGVAKLAAYSDQHAASRFAERSDLSSGLLMGTLRYMSPEQASGRQVDPRSDIFSLGVVLYEMIAGHPPFQGETPTDVMDSVLHQEPQSLAGLPLNIPERLVRTVEKALGKNRETRYGDANAFMTDLKAAKHELELEAKFRILSPPTLPAAPDKSVHTQQTSSLLSRSIAYPITLIRRHKTAVVLALVAVAIGAAALIYRPRKLRPVSLGSWSEKAPMPKPRAGAAVAALDGRLYVVSGFDGAETIDDVEVYDPATDSWTSRASIPTARTAAGAAAIAGKLYVFGGCGRNSEGNHDCRVGTTNAMEAYDPHTNTWRARAPMPTARSAMATAVIGDRLYVAGGRGPCPPCSPYQVLEIYDPVTDTWDRNAAPLPIALSGAGGAALNGKFYVVGGDLGKPEPQRANLLASYDPAANQWQMGPPLPTPRSELGLEAVHGVLYAIGGVGVHESSTVVEALDPIQNRWSTKASLPFPRMGAQPVAIDGAIYVAGSGRMFNHASPTLHAYTVVCPGSLCVSSPANLIGWWPGDGDVNDVSGRNHGKVQGNVTFAPGKVGRAFNLDGSSFVTMGNPPVLNLTGSQVTLSGWINPRVTAPAIYFGKTRFGPNDYLLLYGRGVGAMISVNGVGISAVGYSDFPSKTKLYVPPIGEWTHIAMTYDGKTVVLYANGEIIGQVFYSGNIVGTDEPFNIGGRADDQGTGKFNGLIDEVQVFNRALSADEIRMIFEAGSDGQCRPQASCQ
ncbi:MAG TPA: protein kinase [Pyrinomonadaceae bacterium]